MTNDNNKLIAYVLLVVLLNGFFSINIIEKNKRFYNIIASFSIFIVYEFFPRGFTGLKLQEN